MNTLYNMHSRNPLKMSGGNEHFCMGTFFLKLLANVDFFALQIYFKPCINLNNKYYNVQFLK